MPTFDLSRLDRFVGTSTTIRRPREFTFFSFDDTHVLKPLSTESLSYYYPALFDAPGASSTSVELSRGFDLFKQRDDTVDEHLDGLLQTLQAYEERILDRVRNGEGEIKDVRVRADIITWRGMMTKILTAPFDDMFGDFEMNATCFQVRCFIEENHAYKAQQNQVQNDRPPRRGEASQALMQYWGYKFESLSVLPRPWAECSRDEIEGREAVVVNNHPQYCSIVRTGIGTTSLVLAGEVDAVLGEKPQSPDDPIPWIELKTSAQPDLRNPKDVIKLERRLLKYWAQSFLLGVPRIIVGYRTSEGRLTSLSEIETQRIPGMVKRGQGLWNGNVCINMSAAFLDFLKQIITGDGVWRIMRRKNARAIEVFKVSESGTAEIIKPTFKAHREKLLALEMSAALG
ncbi:hypothetical protein BAUCODRAFT_121609 [Baudoinia panamericana UAMH 10762]|uniref:Decapping nuclease n=1 Tax=Baudoinia panamericana (strain UAMH 10762) TaxID=717646 RepID=M2NDW3_BAUPA|nr:uncharacterized protein BAUCODRAFT_121609 [Baudoinia panamericana UAMH 10762]EMC97100.1 hypothetical protein BAUCODRAFT_121609 [Baudoinia panamericana UAMH 10762]